MKFHTYDIANIFGTEILIFHTGHIIYSLCWVENHSSNSNLLENNLLHVNNFADSLNTLSWYQNNFLSIINGFIFFFGIDNFLVFLGKRYCAIKQRLLNMYSIMLNCRRGNIFSKIHPFSVNYHPLPVNLYQIYQKGRLLKQHS